MLNTSTTTYASNSTSPPPYPSIPPPPNQPQNSNNYNFKPIDRRHILASIAFSISTPLLTFPILNDSLNPFSVPSADARGLFQMPPVRFTNRYFLVRAGESEYESWGIINTNPVTKTSMDSGLSETGKKQAVRAARTLKAMGACDNNCWIWPSITQRAYQAAEIIAAVNGVSRSYIVPEYSFLDVRGLGAYEGKDLGSVSEIAFLQAPSHHLLMMEPQMRV